MASTKAQEKSSKKYYHSNQKYREKKIAETQRKQKANRPKYNKDKREYYEENEELTFNLSDNWSDYEYDNDDCDYFVNVTKKLRLDPDYPDTD